jgi:hypothetical protein
MEQWIQQSWLSPDSNTMEDNNGFLTFANTIMVRPDRCRWHFWKANDDTMPYLWLFKIELVVVGQVKKMFC